MRTFQLYIEGQRVDLFNDETVEITQTIQNVRDISKIFTDFSKTFTLPASKTNNLIFKHYYNYGIDNGFDARKKVEARIEINNVLFTKGKIKLEGVDLKDSVPQAYRVIFFGSTVDLKDLLGEDKLNGLEGLDVYDQTYSATRIRTALTDGIDEGDYTQAIIAPLISHTDRLYYDSTTSESGTRNLHPSGSVQQGVYYGDLKYAIRAHLIIKAIEQTYGITFSEDFFITENLDWYNLYLWLHRKKGGVFDGTSFTTLITGYDPIESGTNVVVEIDRILVFGDSPKIDYTLVTTTSSPQTYTVTIKKDGTLYATAVCDNATSLSISGDLINSSTGYQVFVEAESTFTLTASWSISDIREVESFEPEAIVSLNSSLEFIITEQIPDMKVIDFLTGIFKMFNLTAYITYEANGQQIINVKTLDSFYASAPNTWYLTRYVNTDSYSVDAALPYKEINFRYSGRKTLLAEKHEEVFNEEWGTADYTGDDFFDSSPETYNIEVPFEHLKYERLFDGDSTTRTNVQVGLFVDGSSNPYYGLPLLFYGVESTGTTIRFLNDLSSSRTDITTYFVPSNSRTLDASVSTSNIHFNVEANEYTFNTDFTGTLFNNYYFKYIASVFNSKQRISTFTAELPMVFLSRYTLADIIYIGVNRYVINSITTNLTSGKSKLELINFIDLSIDFNPIPSTTTTTTSTSTTTTTTSTTTTTTSTTTEAPLTLYGPFRSSALEGNGQSTSEAACEIYVTYAFYTDATSIDNIIVGSKIYTTSSGGLWSGASEWYGIANNVGTPSLKSIRIDNSGNVIDIATCTTTTTTTTTTFPLKDELLLGRSAFAAEDACAATRIVFYADAATLTLATELYLDEFGSTFANPGFYADDSGWREWSGTAFVDSGVCPITTTTTATPPPPTTTLPPGSLLLGRSAFASEDACSATKDIYWADGVNLSTSTALYLDSGETTFAPPGYYSDSTIWRYWNGSAFTTSGSCGA